LAEEVAAAEKSFEMTLMPRTEADEDSPQQLLEGIHANWRAHGEVSVDKYRQLAARPESARFLPLARRYFSNLLWKAKWFPSTTDPVAHTDAWRALADTPAAVSSNNCAILCFPYQGRSPRELGFDSNLTANGPPAENWGMIATATVHLPPGKWRIQIEADGGVRALVNGKPLINSWKADSTGIHTGEFQQEQTGDVNFTAEHFVAKPCESFEFLLIPILDGK
jgi:hypothetical protein